MLSFWHAKAELVVVDSIFVSGNELTKKSIILRELTFYEGNEMERNQLFLDNIPQSKINLANLNVFNRVNINIIEQDSGHLNVYIVVDEKWYWWPIPYLEFADRNFNQWYQFKFDPYRTNYGLYLFRYNISGRNQTLKLGLSNGYTQRISALYKATNLLKNQNGFAELAYSYKSNQEVWYKTENNQLLFFRQFGKIQIKEINYTVGLGYRPKFFGRHSLKANLNQIWVADTLLSETLNPKFLVSNSNQQRILTTEYGYESDHRNFRFFPTQGRYRKFAIGHHFLNETKLNFYSFLLEFSDYKQLPKIKPLYHWSVATSNTIKLLSGGQLPYYQTRMMGYEYTARGFENRVADGKGMFLNKIDLRYEILNRKKFKWPLMPLPNYKVMPVTTFLSLFVDQAFVQESDKTKYFLGYGVGVNSLFYSDKVFRFEYSTGINNSWSLKIHFKKAF
ncbi:MAG: hypothetical protein H6607_07160 [Flavobacteriales bacterium]|nr:hypothetical protein [Flavobacteriales bacterium]